MSERYMPPDLPVTAIKIPDAPEGANAFERAQFERRQRELVQRELAAINGWRIADGTRSPMLDALADQARDEGNAHLAFWLRHIGCDGADRPKRVLTLGQAHAVCPLPEWREWIDAHAARMPRAA